MSDAFHGYYGKSGYTFGYYPETMPRHLKWACALQGHEAPIGKFRYLDAGCGQGFNLIIAAACYPDAEFVGVDFLPEHIAHAQSLAERAGLNNISFIEADFVKLADEYSDLGLFDYVVCHGIATWIAPEVRAALFQLVGNILRPGGVFYNSYNTFPGWLTMLPFQHLVRLEQQTKPGPEAIASAKTVLTQLHDMMPSMFSHLPALKDRLTGLEKHDPSYLLQEYNHQSWQPLFVSDVIEQLEALKLNYIGTATLSEIDETTYPEQFRKLLASQKTIGLKEQIKDYATSKSFRRDIFVKGRRAPWKIKHEQLIRNFRLSFNPLMKYPDENQNFSFSAGSLSLQGDRSFYISLLDIVKSNVNGLALGKIIDLQVSLEKKQQVISAVNLLVSSGYLQLMDDKADNNAQGKRLNSILANDASEGAPYKFIALPRIGGAVSVLDTDWLIINFGNEKNSEAKLSEEVLNRLSALGRAIAHDGKPVNDKTLALKLIRENISLFETGKKSYFKLMGGI